MTPKAAKLARCLQCDRAIVTRPEGRGGRRREYCSDRCRKRASRARQARRHVATLASSEGATPPLEPPRPQDPARPPIRAVEMGRTAEEALVAFYAFRPSIRPHNILDVRRDAEGVWSIFYRPDEPEDEP